MIKELVLEFKRTPEGYQWAFWMTPINFKERSGEFLNKSYDPELDDLHTWFNVEDSHPDFKSIKDVGIFEKFRKMFAMIKFKTKLRELLNAETNYDVDEFVEWVWRKHFSDSAPYTDPYGDWSPLDEILVGISEITSFDPRPHFFVIMFYILAIRSLFHTNLFKFAGYYATFFAWLQFKDVMDPELPFDNEKIVVYSYFTALVFSVLTSFLALLRTPEDLEKSVIRYIYIGFFVILFYILKWIDSIDDVCTLLDFINFYIDLILYFLILTWFNFFIFVARKDQFAYFIIIICCVYIFYGWFVFFCLCGFGDLFFCLGIVFSVYLLLFYIYRDIDVDTFVYFSVYKKNKKKLSILYRIDYWLYEVFFISYWDLYNVCNVAYFRII